MFHVTAWLHDTESTYWSGLSRLGQSRILATSYIWMILVPVAARMLEAVGRDTTIDLFGWQLVIGTLGLPFSWKVFFYASVAVSIAGAIYSLRCPKAVRAWKRYSEFTDEGRGAHQLIRLFFSTVREEPPEKRDPQIDIFCNRYTDFRVKRDGPLPLRKILESSMSPHGMPDAFWHTRDFGETTRPFSRLACLLSYLVGFGLLLLIAGENLYYVVKWTF